MPRRMSRSLRRSGTSNRRKYAWRYAYFYFTNITLQDGDYITEWARVPAGELDSLAPDQPQIVDEDWTLVRSRVIWSSFQTIGGAQANSPNGVSLGIIKWTGTDENSPLIAPNAAKDLDDDWIFRSVAINQQTNTSIFPGGGESSIESRAMRKLSHGEGILMSFGLAWPVAPATSLIFNIGVDIRMLFKQS